MKKTFIKERDVYCSVGFDGPKYVDGWGYCWRIIVGAAQEAASAATFSPMRGRVCSFEVENHMAQRNRYISFYEIKLQRGQPIDSGLLYQSTYLL